MNQAWLYTIISVLIISVISLIGIFTLSIKKKRLETILIYFVSFSAGALFGDAFLHLLPEIIAEHGFTLQISFYVLLGILLLFFIEKVIRWRHCHHPREGDHVHPFAIMNLVGDAVHNFIDGLIIAASYLVSIPVGIATTMAVAFHEIPQEIGDFGVLLHGGYSKGKALFFNFLTASTAILGAIIALVLSTKIEGMELFLVPLAAGGFIYIAGSDLIPELHKDIGTKKTFLQITFFCLGIAIMYALLHIH